MLNELLVVNNVMVVEVRRAAGSIVERYAGPSEEQMKYEHDVGKCGAMCGYCYHEAAEWLAANADVAGLASIQEDK
jgi:hypothetical protein